MMSQQCLILFAVFAESGKAADENGGSDKAAAGFLFMLFLVYGVFGLLLGTFRNKILEDDSGGDVGNNVGQTL